MTRTEAEQQLSREAAEPVHPPQEPKPAKWQGRDIPVPMPLDELVSCLAIFRRTSEGFILIYSSRDALPLARRDLPRGTGQPAGAIFSDHPDIVEHLDRSLAQKTRLFLAASERDPETNLARPWYFTFEPIVPDLVVLTGGATDEFNGNLYQAIEQLTTYWEELSVANQELQQSNTDLEEARTALELERIRYQELFDFAPDGYLITDGRGMIREANRAASRMLNLPALELIGKPFQVFIAMAAAREFRTHLSELGEGRLDSACMKDWTVTLQPWHTAAFPAALTVSAERDANGRAVAIRWLLHDASERQRAEEQIRDLNLNLENRVAERTADLQLANEELEAFTYSISHDLRIPLTLISHLTDLVRKDFSAEVPAQVLHNLELIHESSVQSDRLLTDLLQFSRASRRPLARRVVDTTGLVQEVLEELKPQYLNRHVEIEIGDPASGFKVLPPSDADPLLLKQVYVNLLTNALKFSRVREVARIRVGFRQEGGEGIFFVADNGVGFDMADAGRLFGVFQRLHPEEEYEGTGIGLAIVARVIRRHGGRVWAEAEVDGGATFFLTLGPPSSRPALSLETNQTDEET